jgi:hypothetical protein
MTKRRSSISGRGAEILLGKPSPVEVQPRSPAEEEFPEAEPLAESAEDSTSESPPSPLEAEVLFEDPEIEKALREEALDGEVGPDREEDFSVLEKEPPVTPEMEQAFFEEAMGAEEPPDPVDEAPVPTLEVTMEEKDVLEEVAINEPPPPEASDVASGVLPPRSARPLPDMGDLEAMRFDVQDSEEKVEPLELPEEELTEEENQQILARLGNARIARLERSIRETYEEVRRRAGENDSITTESFNMLLKAQNIVLHRDASKIAQAEYYVEQVRARMKRVAESDAAAKKYQWWILVWGLVWGAVYMTALVLLNQSWFHDIVVPSEDIALVDMEVFLSAMLWGGIGGVVAVLYSLFKHVGRRDFDPQYNISYIGKPFLGIVLGATVYMIFNLVIRTLGILPAGVEGVEGTATPDVAPGVIYLMAWACGFKENRIFDLLDRVMKRIFSGEESAPPTPPAAAEPTP